MLYRNIRPLILYQGQSYLPLPRGEAQGYDNALFILSPGQSETITELQSDYMRWFLDGYRYYTTDTIFREKIGKKHIIVNMTQVLRRDWANTVFPHPLRRVMPRERLTKLQKSPNVIVDLGEWIKFYFQYSFKVSIPIIVRNFVAFLAAKVNVEDYARYKHKMLVIPLNLWHDKLKSGLGFSKAQLNNPLSILLFAAYKYPDLIGMLPEMDIMLVDRANQQFMRFSTSDLNHKNFALLKNRLSKMDSFKWDDKSEQTLDVNFTEEEMDPNSELNNTPDLAKYEDPRNVAPTAPEDASYEEKVKAQKRQNTRAQLINSMKRELLGGDTSSPSTTSYSGVKTKKDPSQTSGNTETLKDTSSAKPQNDLTVDESIYDDDDLAEQMKDVTPIRIEDERMDDDIDEAVDDAIFELEDEDEDILDEPSDEEVAQLKAKVAKKLKKTYMPSHPDNFAEKVQTLKAAQDKVLPPMPTTKQLKSKIIDESDFSKAIKTSNPNITKSKFVNFDRDYTQKKLPQDLDNAVAALNQASNPIFVTSKEEVDSSTQLDLKKTVTYHLEDEWGGKHTITVDVPIVIEDKYIYHNGQKLLMGHQQIMMPIVKANPTDVQIVTWYNKLTLRREGVNDTRTSAVKRYMSKWAARYDMKLGNASAKNTDGNFKSTLDVDMYAKQYMGFRIGSIEFDLDRASLLKKIETRMPNAKLSDEEGYIPVGIDKNKNEIVYVTPQLSLTDIIMDILPEEDRQAIVKSIKPRELKLLRTNVKVMKQMIPLAVLLCYYEPFEEVMKKAELNYFILDKDEDGDAELAGIDRGQYDVIECEDKYIVWERNPIWNTMLMNGFNGIDLQAYTYEEICTRDTFANIISNYWSSPNITFNLMQFYDFMIDPATKEILEDYNLPTDLVSLMLLGNRMLADNDFTAISNAKAFRVRSNEVIAESLYNLITTAYLDYRKTQSKMGRNKKPNRLNVKPSALIDQVTRGSSLTNEASVLNPILELEKARSITPRGPRGVGKERAMTEQKRAYDPSMIGIMGMTTSPDYKVGVNRQLTLEPKVTSTRGYVEVTDMQDVDSLNSANLLTPSELLSPPGVLHDDGPRTAMSYKQSQYMLPVDGSTPVFFGNRVESVVPYHMSREFVIVAKNDGQVVDIQDGVIIVQYKDGTYDSIDTNPRMRKNASSGFFIKTVMQSDLTQVGQKFKKNEVIAQDPRAFTKDSHDLGASMNIGVPIKMAIIPNYDIYEDAAPITEKLSEKFTTHMSMQASVGIPAQSYVESIVKVGDEVRVGDPLIVYDPAHEDEETNAFLNEIREKLGENLASIVDLESLPKLVTEYAGKIAAIEIYTSVPVDELSLSLQEIYRNLTSHDQKTQELLTKYQNEGDMAYYKCGRIMDHAPEVIKPDYQNRVKGVTIGEDGRGVAIFFYIEFKDIAKTGDKGSAFTALKFTTSHVIPKGKEPYSEYRPDEEISTLLAPSSVLARKTPSILETMFANKCIIEMKRHALAMFFEDKDPDEV